MMDEDSVRVLSRAFLILRTVARHGRSLSIKEITDAVVLPYPTVHRLVMALQREAILVAEGSPRPRYKLAAESGDLSLGHALTPPPDIHPAAGRRPMLPSKAGRRGGPATAPEASQVKLS